MATLTLTEALEEFSTAEKEIEQDVVAKMTPELRANYDDVLNGRRERLNRMVHKTDQIDGYGAEQWQEDFIRLSTLEELPETNLWGEKLRNYIWSSIPNSHFKRFQEAFCDPKDFVVPPFHLDGRRIVFENQEWESVKGCLADPDKVPDKLLKDLKIFTPEKRGKDKLKALEQKYDSLPALKKIWESCNTLEDRNYRMLAIGNPSSELDEQYPDIEGPDPDIAGSILYTREQESELRNRATVRSKGRPPRRLIVSYFDNAYAAVRKTKHEEHQYEHGEIGPLARLQSDVKSFGEIVGEQWKPGADEGVKHMLLNHAAQLALRADEELGGARSPIKIRILEQINGVREQLGLRRVNPSRAKTVGASNAIDARLQDISPKGGFNQIDRMVLQKHIKENEYILKESRSDIAQKARKVGLGLDVYNPKVSQAAADRTVQAVTRELTLPRHAGAVPLRPFITYIKALNSQSAELETGMRKGDKNAAQLAVVRMHVIGKFQAAQTFVEQLKDHIAYPEEVNMEKVRKFTDKIVSIFEGRELFPDTEPVHFAAMYEPVEEELRKLRGVVAEAGPDIESDLETLAKFCVHLREHLDTFSLESLTRELVQKAEAEQN